MTISQLFGVSYLCPINTGKYKRLFHIKYHHYNNKDMNNIFKFLTLVLLVASVNAQAQIGINNPTPDPSAALDVSSTTQGMLVPRMTQAQRTAIASPATGLLVYQTDATAGFYFYNGTAWTSLNGTNGQGVPTGGTAGQVLAKVDATNYNTQWVTPGAGSGAQVVLRATKTTDAQVLPLANGTNTGALVTFNNVISNNTTLGTYSTSTNTLTINQTGLYMVQAVTRLVDASNPAQTVNHYLWVDIDNAGMTNVNTLHTIYQAANGPNFPSGVKGKGFVNIVLYLNAGQVINIKGLGANSSTTATAATTDGSCQLMVVKL